MAACSETAARTAARDRAVGDGLRPPPVASSPPLAATAAEAGLPGPAGGRPIVPRDPRLVAAHGKSLGGGVRTAARDSAVGDGQSRTVVKLQALARGNFVRHRHAVALLMEERRLTQLLYAPSG